MDFSLGKNNQQLAAVVILKPPQAACKGESDGHQQRMAGEELWGAFDGIELGFNQQTLWFNGISWDIVRIFSGVQFAAVCLTWLDVLAIKCGWEGKCPIFDEKPGWCGIQIFINSWLKNPSFQRLQYPVQSSGVEAFEVLNVHDNASISVSAHQRYGMIWKTWRRSWGYIYIYICPQVSSNMGLGHGSFMVFYGDIMWHNQQWLRTNGFLMRIDGIL